MIERAPTLAAGTPPRHVAIIMDGNRRWAAERRLPAIEGHRRGMRTLRRIVTSATRAGIDVLTVYAFSEENWQRDRAEVGGLMDLAATFARGESQALAREGVRVTVIGRRDRLPAAVRNAFERLESATASQTRLHLNLAVDYGARGEMCAAMQAIARDVAAGRLAPADIDEDAVGRHLWTAGTPDPDLLIRTGGDLRLSNFLLYQCAYTELWSTPTQWPAFDERAFTDALASFSHRQRRFGQ